MEKSNFKLQLIAVEALSKKYGFSPAPQMVTLLESDGEGKYILFRVGEHEYRFENGEIINIEDHEKLKEKDTHFFDMYMEAKKDKESAEDRIKELSARIGELGRKLRFREADLTKATMRQEELEDTIQKITKRINELHFEIHRMNDQIRKLEPAATALIEMIKDH